MCGLCGIYCYDRNKVVDRNILIKMNNKLLHRGPDSEGYYVKNNVGLAHRRLKIIDLITGDQPMSNEDNSIWIVYDGKIYNYVELRKNLEKNGHKFKSQSDTEVIIHLYETYNEECLKYLRGMFAFAIWDENKHQLFLARDRIGKKPLVYMEVNNKFIFASEIKALIEYPEYKIDIDWFAVGCFFAYEYWIPWPYSIFKGIKKLEPATYLIIKDGVIVKRKYWFPKFTPKIKKNENELIEELNSIFEEAVKLRLQSDVPLGALLSGGVDSSGVVATMMNYLPKVSTFSIGFNSDKNIDEEFLRARKIANKFKTNHHEILFSEETLKYLPIMIYNHDEPFANITSLYIWYLTKFIKECGVTVVLSGNGPDEIFLGYSSGYKLKIESIIRKILQIFPKEFFSVLPNNKVKTKILKKYQPYFKTLSSSVEKKFIDNTSNLFNSEIIQITDEGIGRILEMIYQESQAENILDGYSYQALMLTYSHGLTVHTDASAMANAVEIRSPFLDYKIIEFAFILPQKMKVKGFSEKGCKYIVKKMMEKKIPKELIYTKKFGFGYNISWPGLLLNKYGVKTKEILLNGKLCRDNILKRDYIEKIFSQNSKNLVETGMQVLRLLTFEIWFRIYILRQNLQDIVEILSTTIR